MQASRGHQEETVRRLAIVVVLSALLTFAVGAAPAAAAGGNSGNAKLCQKNGWKSLVRSDGTPFANQGDCVSYGAQGGTPSPPAPVTPDSPDALLCQSLGGSFDGADLVGLAMPVLWTCNGWSSSTTGTEAAQLQAACTTDAGIGVIGPLAGTETTMTCYQAAF
jgi:hypothetical protein